MAKAEKKTLSEQLETLDAELRKHGHSIADLLVHAAKNYHGIDLTRVIHPIEEDK